MRCRRSAPPGGAGLTALLPRARQAWKCVDGARDFYRMSRPLALIASALLVTRPAQSQTPPDPAWVTISVFHINPSGYGAAPVNMNTGDVLGDMYCKQNPRVHYTPRDVP